MGFYTFHQINSGGSFHRNSDVREYVIVEGTDLDDITKRAERIGLYFNGVDTGDDCECCGDRWHEPYGDMTEVPMIWDTPVDLYEEECTDTANVVIYYMNGIRKYGRHKYSWQP